jgi:hypothetical protein
MLTNVLTSHQLMKDWFFSATKNRYIHRVLSKSKEIEIDIDGSIYMHLFFDFNSVHFRMLKNSLDEMFTSNKSNEEFQEYYYKGDVRIIGVSSSKNHQDQITIEFDCSSDECLEAFLKWDIPTVVNTMEFFRKYCQVLY